MRSVTLIGLLAAIFLTHSAWADKVRVAVASNFLATAKQLAQDFQTRTPHQLALSAASSGKFYAQIRQGAPYDLFLSADAERPQRLFREGVGNKPPVTYAIGQLVLWHPEASQAVDQTSLEQLSHQRLALANPRVAPYGLAAQQLLQQMGLWQKLQAGLVRGENVSQAFHYVRSGNVDMGLVALSQVKTMAIPEAQWWQVPAERYTPIEQQALLIQDNAPAQAVWQYLQSPEARAIIQHNGYALANIGE
ncbi:molybdate ABC transporter substrate-binding protein [Maricurvus nonylphenolicus]|uniref:molybdate ABC transporter substrate-binding protein n=1 Tax=Maricurvus nonylphenolicus TaxID=1008307 RepID=UPI0036F29474